jgi:HD-like signal output (HDOD) protein
MSHADRERLPLYQAETRCIGFDHCRVGLMIGSAWKFGGEILDAIKCHHAIEACAEEHIPFVYTVAVADFYVNTNGIGFSGSRYPEKVPEKALSYLGISWDTLDAMHEELIQEIEKAKVFLKINEE